jgi:hypothetical protein
MHDPADHAPIINARFASRVGRQMGLDLRKLRVRQPKLVPNHPHSPSGAVNHNKLAMPITLWVRTLEPNPPRDRPPWIAFYSG